MSAPGLSTFQTSKPRSPSRNRLLNFGAKRTLRLPPSKPNAQPDPRKIRGGPRGHDLASDITNPWSAAHSEAVLASLHRSEAARLGTEDYPAKPVANIRDLARAADLVMPKS